MKTVSWRTIGDSDAGFAVILAIQVAVIFVVVPLAAMNAVSAPLLEGLRFGLAVTTILVVARRAVVRWAVGVAFAATVLASFHWPFGHMGPAVELIRALATLSFDLIVAGIVAVATFRPGRVTAHRILGAVILYLYIGLIFAALYRMLIPVLSPDFSGIPGDPRGEFAELLYFSFGALTTGGSGEIVALHPVLRSMASLESVIGQLFPATLLARLVSLHVMDRGQE